MPHVWVTNLPPLHHHPFFHLFPSLSPFQLYVHILLIIIFLKELPFHLPLCFYLSCPLAWGCFCVYVCVNDCLPLQDVSYPGTLAYTNPQLDVQEATTAAAQGEAE